MKELIIDLVKWFINLLIATIVFDFILFFVNFFVSIEKISDNIPFIFMVVIGLTPFYGASIIKEKWNLGEKIYTKMEEMLKKNKN